MRAKLTKTYIWIFLNLAFFISVAIYYKFQSNLDVSKLYTPTFISRMGQSARFPAYPTARADDNAAGPDDESNTEVVIYEPKNCTIPEKLNGSRSYCFEDNGVVYCAPKASLLGFRKCGTTDLHMWLIDHPNAATLNIDYKIDSSVCSVELIKQNTWGANDMNQKTAFLDSPGGLTDNLIVKQYFNFTSKKHTLVVRPAVAVLKDFEMADSSYIVQMRNPANRAISALFESWETENYLPGYSLKNITADVIHACIVRALDKTRACIKQYGAHGCIHIATQARNETKSEIKFMVVGGLYSYYLEFAFRTVSNKQFLFSKLEEFSTHPEESMKQMFKHMKIPYEKRPEKFGEIFHKGKKKKPHDHTLQLLKEFYRPHNARLARLLGDDKWLFE